MVTIGKITITGKEAVWMANFNKLKRPYKTIAPILPTMPATA